MASWGDRCPLHGVCSECGLELEWAMVMDAQRRRPAWLVEHAKGWRGVVGASLRNGWSALDGRSWWRRVRLEHAFSLKRLLVHWLVWAVVAHMAMVVVGVATTVAGVMRNYQQAQAMWDGQTQTVRGWTQVWTDHLMAHVKSVAVWPWGSVNTGYAGMRITVWSGVDLAVGGVIACVAMGLGFLLLPFTMGKLDVRRGHLVRAVGYSASVLAAAVVVMTIGGSVMGLMATYGTSRVSEIGMFGVADRTLGLAIVVVAWWGCWWWRFAKEYLRLPRAWLVAVLLTLMGLLAAVAATGMIEDWLARVIGDVKYAIWKWRNP